MTFANIMLNNQRAISSRNVVIVIYFTSNLFGSYSTKCVGFKQNMDTVLKYIINNFHYPFPSHFIQAILFRVYL